MDESKVWRGWAYWCEGKWWCLSNSPNDKYDEEIIALHAADHDALTQALAEAERITEANKTAYSFARVDVEDAYEAQRKAQEERDTLRAELESARAELATTKAILDERENQLIELHK